jgi:hypothetical protein
MIDIHAYSPSIRFTSINLFIYTSIASNSAYMGSNDGWE